MKFSKNILHSALSFAMGIAIVFSATTADAGKRAGDPPFGQRDVVADAAPICSLATEPDALGLACDLLANSDGALAESKGCTAAVGTSAAVVYSLRNCDKNRESMKRFAASAVLSINDWMAPRGKESQLQSAAGYLCGYADKHMLLRGAGKLSGTDLGADAETIVDDYLFLSCVES